MNFDVSNNLNDSILLEVAPRPTTPGLLRGFEVSLRPTRQESLRGSEYSMRGRFATSGLQKFYATPWKHTDRYAFSTAPEKPLRGSGSNFRFSRVFDAMFRSLKEIFNGAKNL